MEGEDGEEGEEEDVGECDEETDPERERESHRALWARTNLRYMISLVPS